jgi:hypothetical protein
MLLHMSTVIHNNGTELTSLLLLPDTRMTRVFPINFLGAQFPASGILAQAGK